MFKRAALPKACSCGFHPENLSTNYYLSAGATLKGRLLKDGSPLSGVRIDISGVDQNAESTAGSYSGGDRSRWAILLQLPTSLRAAIIISLRP